MLVTDAMPQSQQMIPGGSLPATRPDDLEYVKTDQLQECLNAKPDSSPLQLDYRATWPRESFLSVNWLG